MMLNSCPSDVIFNLHRRTIMDYFSCILSLRQLHLDLNMCCFINFALKYLHFSIKKSSVRLLSYTLMSKRLAENDFKTSKMTSKLSYWHHAGELSYTPHVRRHFLALVGFTEIPVGYARNRGLAFVQIMVSKHIWTFSLFGFISF